MRNCPLCGSDKRTPYLFRTYSTCTKCNHTYQPEPPPKSWMNPDEGHGNGYSGEPMGAHERAVNRSLANWIFNHYAPLKTVDVGSGFPYFAQCFKNLGAEAYALDGAFKEDLIQDAELNVNTAPIDWEYDEIPYENVEMVSMVHVLEHFLDPVANLKKAYDILTGEGIMFIRIPNKSVQGIERDHTEGHAAIHPSIFSTESFEYASKLAGFHIVWQEHMSGSGQSSFILRKRPSTISLFMIVKNEEENIFQCLQTVKNHVDEMIVLDTGSSDRTIQEAKRAGAIVKKSKQFTVKTEFKDFNFSKARNEAMSHAAGDWLFWMDADDRFFAPNFKLSPELDAYNIKIQYGNTTFNHARFFRNNWGVKFEGAVHEVPVIHHCRTGFFKDGWVEHSTKDRPDRIGRNVAILEVEREQHPGNTRTLFYLANAYRESGNYDKAIKIYQDYIKLGGSFPDELYLARYYLAQCYYGKRNYKSAVQECFNAIKHDDKWAEAHHLLGQAYFSMSEFKKAICYFGVAMSLPFPETGMFVSKELYSSSPKLWLSHCYEHLGMISEAKKWAEGHPERANALKDRKYTIELQRPGALGDVLCSTAAVTELRKKHPNAHIRYVTHPSSFPMLEGNPDINEVTTESKQADKTILFNYPMYEGYPDTPMRRHLGVYFAENAEVALSPGWKPTLHLLADNQVGLEHKKPVITFAVRTGWSRYKEWPLDRWPELIKQFPDYQFIQLGAAGETEIEGAQYMCGKLTLRESFSVLKQSVLFVGLDSVFNHAAAALEIPAVIMFGSTSPIGSGYSTATNLWSNLRCSPCITGDSLIYTDRGYIPIEDLAQNHDGVRALTSDGSYHDIINAWCSGTKEVWNVQTNSGLNLDCTPDHKFLVIKNKSYHKKRKIVSKIPVCEIENGDWIVTQSAVDADVVDVKTPFPDGLCLNEWSQDLGYVMGLTCGDGSYFKWSGNVYCLTIKAWNDADLVCFNAVRDTINGWFGANNRVQYRLKKQAPPGSDIIREYPEYSCSWRRKSLTKLFEKLGFSKDKPLRCPKSLFNAPLKVVTGFLAGLFDADGSVDYSVRIDKRNNKAYQNNKINLSSAYKELLQDVQLLLLRLGIHSTICKAMRTLPNGKSHYFRLDIGKAKSVNQFIKYIRLRHPEKYIRLHSRIIPNHNRYPIVKVTKIHKKGLESVYDLSVKDQHDFSANGIMISNCYREDPTKTVHPKPPCPYEHECMVDFMTVDKVVEAVQQKLKIQLVTNE